MPLQAMATESARFLGVAIHGRLIWAIRVGRDSLGAISFPRSIANAQETLGYRDDCLGCTGGRPSQREERLLLAPRRGLRLSVLRHQPAQREMRALLSQLPESV
jgi:hypothetical protein